MPERYWLVENIYSYEHEEYFNKVIAVDSHESVIRSKKHDLVMELVDNNFEVYGDEETTFMRYGDLEIRIYVLKEVNDFK